MMGRPNYIEASTNGLETAIEQVKAAMTSVHLGEHRDASLTLLGSALDILESQMRRAYVQQCPGCSSKIADTRTICFRDYSQCRHCDGIYGTLSLDIFNLLVKDAWYEGNDDDAEKQYYDFFIEDKGYRTHGWRDRLTKTVVQVG